MSLFDFLQPAPHIPEITDSEKIRRLYRHWRLRIFSGVYIGYLFYYFARKSMTFAIPSIMVETGYSMTDMGLLGSLFSIIYGMSKFAGGVIGDRSNPRYFMALGLFCSGLANILFGFSSSLFFFAAFTAVNSFFQGWGWPPCARQLMHWYSQKERGRWWSVCNTSQSLGTSGIAILGAVLASSYGWRAAMYVPGLLCIGAAFFILYQMRDTPQSVGLPPIEKFKNDYPAERRSEENELSAKELLFHYVLTNRYIWILAIAYFFVYAVRIGVTDWSLLYLTQVKGYSKIAASSCIVAFEAGGFTGNLCAGWASDFLFKGKRGPVSVLCSLLIVAPLWGLSLFSSQTPLIGTALFFLIGLFIYGPQMMIGMHAAELSHKKSAGTATGFVGWFSYLGAACAGYPLSLICQHYGWGAFIGTLIGCSLAALFLLIPLWSVQRRPEQLRPANG